MQLIGLVLVLGSLVILFFQNRAPAIAIQFLGLQTVALPLAVWVVTATVLGLFVGWLIAGLLQMTFVFYRPRFNLGQRAAQSSGYSPSSDASSRSWVDGEEDEFEDEIDAGATGRNRVYEAPQSPRVSLQDGSRYSYSYRDSRQPDAVQSRRDEDELEEDVPTSRAAGKTVDAEYRVLVPPPPESGVRLDPPPEPVDEEWDLDEEEDWDFNDRSSAARRDRW